MIKTLKLSPFLSAGLIALVLACSDSAGPDTTQVPASLTLAPLTDTLRSLGANTQFTAVVKNSNGVAIVGSAVRWSSTNPAVASIDSISGRATAVSNGSVYVRAIATGVVDSVPLVVQQRVDPSKSTITITRPQFFVGESVRVTLEPRDALSNPISSGGFRVDFAFTGTTSSAVLDAVVAQPNGTYTTDLLGLMVGTPVTLRATIDGVDVSTPMPNFTVVGFTKVAAVSGFNLTCGSLTTGDLYCWGEQGFGLRGTGVVTVNTAAATLVTGNHRWIDFDVGFLSVCGIAENAKLYCWGDTSLGNLGTGATSGTIAAPVVIVPDLGFAAISLGLGGGTCAITSGHAAMCWGSGAWGRLGNGTETVAFNPVAVSGSNSFAAIGTSFSGTCAVTDAGIAKCWGTYPVLGIGSSPSPDTCQPSVGCAKTPVTVAGDITFKPIIFHGGNEACAIATNGRTYCWGLFERVPTEVPGAPIFTSITTGDMDNCGIAEDGSVWCWGTNRNGRFGLPANANEIHRVPERVPANQHFIQLSMGQTHTCGVAIDGNAWCWGSNSKGELGDRTTTPSAVPVRVRIFAP